MCSSDLLILNMFDAGFTGDDLIEIPSRTDVVVPRFDRHQKDHAAPAPLFVAVAAFGDAFRHLLGAPPSGEALHEHHADVNVILGVDGRQFLFQIAPKLGVNVDAGGDGYIELCNFKLCKEKIG